MPGGQQVELVVFCFSSTMLALPSVDDEGVYDEAYAYQGGADEYADVPRIRFFAIPVCHEKSQAEKHKRSYQE